MDWINIKEHLPEKGTLVTVMTKKGSCICQGYQETDCYYDGVFQGIKNQSWITKWKVSDLDSSMDKQIKEAFRPECINCV